MRLQIAQRTELALRALQLLEASGEQTLAKDLAPELGTTAHYLPQVLRPLVRAGWLESNPGPSGGYKLVSDLGRLYLLDLIELLEGPTDNQICILKGGPCDDSDQCALHHAWIEVRGTLMHQLSEISLSTTGKELGL